MDLIIKPTQACNFNCDFCSSNNIDNTKSTLELNYIFDFLKKYNTNTIIVNGGDPLMVSPSYYQSILDFIDDNKLKTTLSLTTNLWDFYINPQKWLSIFNHKNVYIATSFQYGGERKTYNGIPITEELFKKIIEKFKFYCGYVPIFISVITNKNENDVLKTVLLAKELNTKCKINPAVCSGRNKYFYPMHKAFKKYLEIIELGLSEYEHNSLELIRILKKENTICPLNRDCYKTIRCLGPQGELFTCGSLHDDYISRTEKKQKTYNLNCYSENEIKKDFPYIKSDCLSCQLFYLCNGCYKKIIDIKEAKYEENHCRGMKYLEKRLLSIA